nr:adhesion G-protein coupled receptor G2-like [Lytechinus pictus]
MNNRVLREKQTNSIFICLCATLLCLYISFIVMMMLDTARQECRIKDIGCGFIAGLIHYFVLSSMTWMGVEGYNTYLIIVKIFNTYIEKFMYKAAAVAWGLPAMIVIVTGFIRQEKYIHQDLCFLEVSSQIGGLLIPITIIVLVNAVIFALVVVQLMKSSNFAGRVRVAKSNRRETIERVENAICILLLLGLTWITSLISNSIILFTSQISEPIFIALNALQGLFIFLLYCVRKPMVRKQWGLTCLGKGEQ